FPDFFLLGFIKTKINVPNNPTNKILGITINRTNRTPSAIKLLLNTFLSMGTPHPMTEEHYIMWIELICKNNCYKRKFLKPGDEPKVTFVVADTDVVGAREYCNLHGLWKS
ncbi:unnamed protein product, partial [marine sediment metagenome]